MSFSFFTKNSQPRAGYYRTSDIARGVDRSLAAIIRWEKLGLIPKAKWDSGGWRIYTKHQVEEIIELIRKTKYFIK